MRIEVEMGAALTVGALRDFVVQVERSGGGPAAYVTFSKRRGDGVVVACAEFEPARSKTWFEMALEAESRGEMMNDGVGLTHPPVSDG